MNRRKFLFSIAGGVTTSLLRTPAHAAESTRPKKTQLGIDDFSYNIRLRAERQLGDPLTFLDYCHKVGAGGVQMNIGIRDEAYTRKLRRNSEEYGMFIEGSASLPRNQSNVEKFENVVRTAKQAGAKVIRIAIGGRRYEQFDRAEQFKAFAKSAVGGLQLAEPVAARHKIRLAIENHKDWRVADMLDMLQRLSSEYVGVCVDTGNSFALLEDPMEVVEAYAPWGFAVHLKDMAVAEYEDGFLLADVPLGEGLLDLSRMVQILRKVRSEIQFSLEMATRDPLKVPCLTEKYWVTFEDVPGSDLARTLKYVRANASPERLAKVSHLPLERQVELEEQNISKCLRYAAEHLIPI